MLHAIRSDFSGFLQTLFGICHILGCIAHVEEDQLASILGKHNWFLIFSI
jgi:hypothetical protein